MEVLMEWPFNYFAIVLLVIGVGVACAGIVYVKHRKHMKRVARLILDGRMPPPPSRGFDQLLSDLMAANKAMNDSECLVLYRKLVEKRQSLGDKLNRK